VEKILLVAAEAFEFSGILSVCARSETLDWPIQYARSVQCGDRRLFLAANGPGPELAREAVMAAVVRENPDKVVNTGFCGALDPSLDIGDVVVASSIDAVDLGRCYITRIPRYDRPATTGRMVSVGHVVQTAAEKRALRDRDAVAVEMEAASVAAWAEERNLPFYCVRAVTDRAAEDFVVDFNTARDETGRFSRYRILGAALKHPLAGIPELIRLARRGSRAARNLGEFIVNCCF
jgi:adenosylhomocysteine nucleosidase